VSFENRVEDVNSLQNNGAFSGGFLGVAKERSA